MGSGASVCSSFHAGLWAVVNNAGVSTFGEVEFTSVDTYKQVSEVNLWGTIRVTKAVLPLIRRAKGKLEDGVFLVSMTAAKIRRPKFRNSDTRQKSLDLAKNLKSYASQLLRFGAQSQSAMQTLKVSL